MKKQFRSNGKLFLLGEYVVMDGSKALALPTKYGQCLLVDNLIDEKNILNWQAYKYNDEVWFTVKFKFDDLTILDSTNIILAKNLQHILLQTKGLKESFFDKNSSYNCTTKLDYPQEWGLGSSSTLIDLISQWIEIDPFQLNSLTFNTSGYDIACARHVQPILYSNKPKITIEKLTLDWNFKKDLFFVYLNKKQDAQAVVGNHYKNKIKDTSLINKLSLLVTNAIKVKHLQELEMIIDEYEDKLSNFMGIPTVKELYFSDYKGSIKSLGAWGGDFVLVTKREGFENYFKEKGYKIIVPYLEMVFD